ncbi:odorant receptor 67c-like, partial [Pogonomyrmex barbatus]|uniref:Odorant receptor 67c-like n=1 Tax=Pogonomyrmex barbatus TaxID=144034 RepID=A0A6I9WPE0_9HYME
FISTGAISFVTAPITIPIFDTILALNVTRPKQMPHPTEFFVDMKRYYYILLVITFAGYAACSAVAIATDTIYVALLQHVCGVLAILSYRLEKLDVHNKSEYTDLISKVDKNVEKMIECIQLQIRTERLIKLIESTFAICFLTDIGLGILLQCSACVMIVTDMDTTKIIKHCPILLMQSTRIFFNSWVGQKIIDHSSQISDATYNGRWYQMSSQVKRMVLFVMMKSTKPYCVKMAKLYVICLESYGSLMKASASYITLMLSLTSDDV